VRDIVIYDDKRLRQVSENVEKINSKIRTIIQDMIDTMYARKGIGLSAIQIGIPLRIVLANPTLRREDLICLINPEIISYSEKQMLFEEGCLSIPGVFAKVKRPRGLEVVAVDITGRKIKLNTDGLLSIILQHEIDHTNGILFPDRLTLLRKIKIMPKLIKLKYARKV